MTVIKEGIRDPETGRWRGGIWCDPCLVPIIKALNDGGVRTVASCCGHGTSSGSIALADGRELIIHSGHAAPIGMQPCFDCITTGSVEHGRQPVLDGEDQVDAAIRLAEDAEGREVTVAGRTFRWKWRNRRHFVRLIRPTAPCRFGIDRESGSLSLRWLLVRWS